MTRMLVVTIAVLLITFAFAGCRPEQAASGTPTPMPMPPVAPAPEEVALDMDLGEGQSVGAPIAYANLTVYPVRSSVHAEIAEYLTLEEALRDDLIDVTEKGHAEVNQVLVSSRAKLPIYLMAGEVILGGNQDRVVAKDTVIEPGATNVAVRVFCVEAGRWHGKTVAFEDGSLQASTAVRKAAQLEGDQGLVWEAVADANVEAEASPGTQAYRAGARDSDLAKKAQAYVDEIAPQLAEGDDIVGVVVAVDGAVIGADVYGSPALFRKLQGKLLAAHARDAAASAAGGEAVDEAPSATEAGAFLREARRGTEVQAERMDRQTRRQVASDEAVGFQMMQKAGDAGAAEVLHENYYSETGSD